MNLKHILTRWRERRKLLNAEAYYERLCLAQADALFNPFFLRLSRIERDKINDAREQEAYNTARIVFDMPPSWVPKNRTKYSTSFTPPTGKETR